MGQPLDAGATAEQAIALVEQLIAHLDETADANLSELQQQVAVVNTLAQRVDRCRQALLGAVERLEHRELESAAREANITRTQIHAWADTAARRRSRPVLGSDARLVAHLTPPGWIATCVQLDHNGRWCHHRSDPHPTEDAALLAAAEHDCRFDANDS